MFKNWKGSLGMALGLGMAFAGVQAQAGPTVAQPGAINYVEGQARIGNQTLTAKSVGSTSLGSGDVLSTGDGRVEFLLTPGVFMRIDKNSAVRMDSPELTNTRVEVLQGKAMVEADVLHDEDHVLIAERGASTELQKHGVYAFDANTGVVQTFDGKATVRQGDEQVDVGKGKEVVVNQPLTTQKFDRDAAKASDPLYSWSKLRSEYLAEATAATARTYVVNGGGWYGPGWYWNPGWSMYSFVPGDGFFYNPFGWGLYSPVYVYRSPAFYPRVHRAFPGRVYPGRGFAGGVTPRVQAPAMRSPGMRSPGIGAMRGRR